VIAQIEQDDMILIDSDRGILQVLVSEGELAKRNRAMIPDREHWHGMGRELFGSLRAQFTGAEQGACSLFMGKESCYDAS
jgi:phosphogluconate dehydratase